MKTTFSKLINKTIIKTITGASMGFIVVFIIISPLLVHFGQKETLETFTNDAIKAKKTKMDITIDMLYDKLKNLERFSYFNASLLSEWLKNTDTNTQKKELEKDFSALAQKIKSAKEFPLRYAPIENVLLFLDKGTLQKNEFLQSLAKDENVNDCESTQNCHAAFEKFAQAVKQYNKKNKQNLSMQEYFELNKQGLLMPFGHSEGDFLISVIAPIFYHNELVGHVEYAMDMFAYFENFFNLTSFFEHKLIHSSDLGVSIFSRYSELHNILKLDQKKHLEKRVDITKNKYLSSVFKKSYNPKTKDYDFIGKRFEIDGEPWVIIRSKKMGKFHMYTLSSIKKLSYGFVKNQENLKNLAYMYNMLLALLVLVFCLYIRKKIKLGINQDLGELKMLIEKLGNSESLNNKEKNKLRKHHIKEINKIYTIFENVEKDKNNIKNMSNQLVEMQKSLMYSLSEVIEAKSKETSNHVKRVALYSAAIARKIGLKKSDIEKIVLVSPLHDMGKVGIPDAILNKADKLSDAEFDELKNHTLIGGQILRKNNENNELLKYGAIIAEQHHERWDGKGYPRGLAQEEIHIFARITALADVFDALAQDRVYKDAWELPKITQYIKEQSGKMFDPVLVASFFEALDEILLIKEKYNDVVEK